jgi:hypothetical protein
MKTSKKVTLLTVCVLILGLFAGCGSNFDASKYVQAQLDNSYKNDSSLVVSQKIATKEEAEDVYNQGIESEVNAFMESSNAPDSVADRYTEVFTKMMSLASYTVGEATKQDDGSYVVNIEYRKMKILTPTMEKMTADTDKLAKMSEEEIYLAMADCMDEILSGDVEYEDTQTTTVRVEIVNKLYTVNTSDLEALEYCLYDLDGFN